jgi:CheY-like chemotaxis protein
MKKILIIDDDPVFPRVLSDVLSLGSYEIQIAVNGKDGLDVMRKEIPDLVILDLIMPEMSGPEVLKAMHQEAELSKIPVLVCSNMDSFNEISGSLALGAEGYIIKADENLATIVETIENMIGRK